MNRLTSSEITCLYNTDDYGLSFHTIEKQIVGYTGPWMLLVHHSEKNLYFLNDLGKENGRTMSLDPIKADLSGMLQAIKAIFRVSSSPCNLI